MTLSRTRRSLHGVAETVVAGPQHRATGRLRLQARAGGFATVQGHDDVLLVAVELADLVVHRATGEQRFGLRGTYAELAAAAGLPYGGLEHAYADGSGVGPDDVIEVDPDAAVELAAAWAAGDSALRELGRQELGEEDLVPVLWPEHLDVAVTAGAVNYGVSPGDALIDVPYAYVGPHRQRSGPFWNQPFGAARPLSELDGSAGVLAFLVEGHQRAADPS
jgi:hypothetical protein